jgi:hypothetical protein
MVVVGLNVFFFFFTKFCTKEQCCGGVLKNNKTMGDKSYQLDTVGLRNGFRNKKMFRY